jgi:Glucose-6-phosphate 1-dehydrogenase
MPKPVVSGCKQPDRADLVIFGATGDLSMRKLLPALAHMHACCLIAPGSRIIGVVRDPKQAEAWRRLVREALERYAPKLMSDPKLWRGFSRMLRPLQGDLEDAESFRRLRQVVEEPDSSMNALFYFAIPPAYYEITARNLFAAGLTAEDHGWRRLVIEKPFGTDLESARKLNRVLPVFSRKSRSSASTTISARTACRTCSSSVSPTPSSSRSGTAPMSITCRSRWRRRSASNTAAPITNTRACCGT